MLEQSVVVVLGMHRSGTSVLCKAIESLGVEFGDRLLGGDQWNAKGYFEHFAIQQLDDRLLRLLGVRWDTLDILGWEDALPWVYSLKSQAVDFLRKDFAGVPMWGIKDPRMCRLLPFWKGVFDELDVTPRYILALRNPLNVALSLNKRDGMSVRQGSLLWLSHMAAAFRDSAGSPSVVVEYEYLLDDAAAQLDRLASALNLVDGGMGVGREEFVSTFLDKGLQHNQQSTEALNAHPEVPTEVKELYAAMLVLAKSEPSTSDWSTIRKQCEDLMTQWWPHEVAAVGRPNPDALVLRESVAMIGRLRSDLLDLDAQLVAGRSQVSSLAALVGAKDMEIMRLRGELEICQGSVAAKDDTIASLNRGLGLLEARWQQDMAALTSENDLIRGELEAHSGLIRRYELLMKMAGLKLQ